MTHQEIIEIRGRFYEITIVYPGKWMNEFPSSVRNMIQVEHKPKIDLHESDVVNYFEMDKIDILSKIKNHITTNIEKFSSINIEYEFNGIGFNLSRAVGQYIVISLFAYLKTSLK